MTLQPWMFKTSGALALLLGAWLHGHHVGAAGIQAGWDAQRVAEQRAADAAAAKDRVLASLASATYQAQHAEIAAADCRARHAALVKAWPASTQK